MHHNVKAHENRHMLLRKGNCTILSEKSKCYAYFICLFICVLFDATVGNSEYTAVNHRMVRYKKLKSCGSCHDLN